MEQELGEAQPNTARYQPNHSAVNHRVSQETLPPRHTRYRVAMVLSFGQEITLERIVTDCMANNQQTEDLEETQCHRSVLRHRSRLVIGHRLPRRAQIQNQHAVIPSPLLL